MLFPFELVYDTTATLLPIKMANPRAKAMLFTIGMQESRFIHRRQQGGPARGFWQFEMGGGIVGVLMHSQTSDVIRSVLDHLQYDYSPETSFNAIEHNDILACAYARLLLWTVSEPLPDSMHPGEGWRQYLWSWRPGKPHQATWAPFYAQAWGVPFHS